MLNSIEGSNQYQRKLSFTHALVHHESLSRAFRSHANSIAGFLGKVSDYILDNSQLPIFLGAVTSAALLGYHISVRAEGLKETTDLTLLGFRSTYTPQAVYDLFEELGPEGKISQKS